MVETNLGMGGCLGSVSCDICGKDFTTNYIRNHHGITHQYLLGSQGDAGFVAAAQAQTCTCHVTWESDIEAHCILVKPVAGVSRGSRSCYVILKSNTGVSILTLVFIILPLGSDMPTIPCKPILICVV